MMTASRSAPQTEWLTVEEMAEYLKLGRSKVYQMAQEGVLPSVKVGGQWRFDREMVDEWLRKQLRLRLTKAGDVLDRFRSLLVPENVLILENVNKSQALDHLVDRMAQIEGMPARDEIARGIAHREQLMSTGIGLGIGVPHIRLSGVRRLAMVVGICKPPIEDYESIDGEPVWLLFMIVAGLDQQADHLKLVARLSSLVKDEELREALRRADSPEEVCRIFESRFDAGPFDGM